MSIIGILIGALIGGLLAGFLIWFVGRLGLGMEVDGFGPAFKAAIIIAVLTAIIHWVWETVFNYTLPAGVAGAIINLVTSAIVLQSVGKWVKGLRVNGFSGALIASVAIAAVQYLLGLLLSGLVS